MSSDQLPFRDTLTLIAFILPKTSRSGRSLYQLADKFRRMFSVKEVGIRM